MSLAALKKLSLDDLRAIARDSSHPACHKADGVLNDRLQDLMAYGALFGRTEETDATVKRYALKLVTVA